MKTQSLLPLVLASSASALKVPDNVRAFYNQLKNKGTCDNVLATGFYNSEFEGPDMSYCGDHKDDYGVVYLQGPDKFSNLDVDCDGAQGGPQDDGRCNASTDTQETTSIKWIIEQYDIGISDLNPHEHSYVVFGNSGTRPSWKTFNPRDAGVEPASLMAVVCGDQMFYGIWGDSNSDDGPRPSVGEVSISLGTACYGEAMRAGTETGSSHDEPDVLYIAFTGKDAVPGRDGANWTAGNFDDFHASLVGLGDKLVSRIGTTSPGSCTWAGHCAGATCKSNRECSDSLACYSGKCTEPTNACTWAGHCKGAACKTPQDCADSLTCSSGKCT